MAQISDKKEARMGYWRQNHTTKKDKEQKTHIYLYEERCAVERAK